VLSILDEKHMAPLGAASILHCSNTVHMVAAPSMALVPTDHTALSVLDISLLEVTMDVSHEMTGLS
jgi:hypothetical protein